MNSLKTRLLFGLVLGLFCIGSSSSQPVLQHSPLCGGINLALTGEHSHDYPAWFNLTSDANSSYMLIGKRDSLDGDPDRWAEYRFVYQWTLSLDSIPYGSTITGASLTITYESSVTNPTFYFYKVGYPLEVQNDDAIWTQLDGTSIGYGFGNATTLFASFNGQSAFVDSLQHCIVDSTQDNIFRLGVKAILGQNAYATWTNVCCGVELIIQYTPPQCNVKITNVVNSIEDFALDLSRVRGDNNIWDANGNVDRSSLPSFVIPPSYKSWYYRKSHLAETWFTRFVTTPNDIEEKYHQWNNDPFDHYVQYELPNFQLSDGDKFESIAKDVSHTDIDASIELYIDKDGIPFEFRDPWRVDQDAANWLQTPEPNAHDQRTPYLPWDDPATLGIFLDQDWAPQTMPYYSIRPWRYLEHQSDHSYEKKSGLPLAEGDAIFLGEIVNAGNGWRFNSSSAISTLDVSNSHDPYRENNIMFNEDNSAARMIYKAHMLSDLPEGSPTLRCNQRKIDIDSINGVYHMVYESAGEIWYSQSADGTIWSPEELVSNLHTTGTRPSVGAINPSLAVLDSCVYVVYNGDGDIWFATRNNGTWEYPIDTPLESNVGSSATPVVDVGRGCTSSTLNRRQGKMVLVVWEKDTALRYSAIWLFNNHLAEDPILGTYATRDNANPKYPSISCLSDNNVFGVAWRDGSDIRYRQAELWNCNQFYVTLGNIEYVTTDGYTCIFAPSLTHDKNSRPTVAYELKEELDPTYSYRWMNVMTRSFLNGWATTDIQIPSRSWTLTGYGEPFNPTIGAKVTSDTCSDGSDSWDLRIAYNRDWGGGTRTIALDCSLVFDDQETDAAFANMVSNTREGMSLREVFTYPHDGTLTHAIRSTDRNLTKASSTGVLHMVKETKLRSGSHTAVFTLGDPRIESPGDVSVPIAWRAAHDSLVIGVNTTLEEKTRTAPFTIGAGDMLRFERMLHARQSGGFAASLHMKLQVRDAATNEVLREHPVQLQTMTNDTSMWSTQTLALNSLEGRSVYACMSADGDLAGVSVHVSNVLLDDEFLAKTVTRPEQSVAPNGCTLAQNTPNPFNPSTDITFSLVSASHVRVVVSDLLGRTVATLVDGDRNAGTYTVRFDAMNLPGGTYMYTLQTETETLTRRMTLAR